ncbi:alkylphosphonate utilization protein [Cryobacterium sp. TMN-39-2]|nr:alkylphosphonate utilization protein [Cryobacterium sp. TMN-39-2]TFC55540.1 alkylphosphonate utilization protein [Cryobacterium sp. TMB3-1-2]TFC57276.1 alkylphosphonate utilization protein [Cryobacterium sp. TMB1-7]TFC72904.1 alkylphosphonate utilization protein [Cryobacterium sp. TMB3-15]TFC76410.1 alkylphosphonate utilization protein [Cryobacterium sp. TMB3-10]TFC88577.1 alkylphosphonate utilization protein [Cryobacterium sp. TMT4-31]TFD43625.1 alkylphosphonate utilization protein [Cryob
MPCSCLNALVNPRRRQRLTAGGTIDSGPPLYDGEVNETLPPCPECSSELTYEMGALLVCPLCGHEWAAGAASAGEPVQDAAITDAHGSVLADGDSVTIIKDLKLKGSSTVIKVGTKVRGIRLRQGVGDHDIECRIEGVSMQLKSGVVKKA